MSVDMNQETDPTAAEQADDWRSSPIFGAITAIICVGSIIVAPLAAIAHHARQTPAQGQVQQDFN